MVVTISFSYIEGNNHLCKVIFIRKEFSYADRIFNYKSKAFISRKYISLNDVRFILKKQSKHFRFFNTYFSYLSIFAVENIFWINPYVIMLLLY